MEVVVEVPKINNKRIGHVLVEIAGVLDPVLDRGDHAGVGRVDALCLVSHVGKSAEADRAHGRLAIWAIHQPCFSAAAVHDPPFANAGQIPPLY